MILWANDPIEEPRTTPDGGRFCRDARHSKMMRDPGDFILKICNAL